MRAAYYERNGPAAEVLRVGDVDAPQPGPGEVRVKVRTSGVNPSDVKSRAGLTRKIAFARVIPHSDGAGEIEMVGAGVSASRIGERVWTWNAQWKRPFGTAAEYVVLPEAQAVPLPASVSFEAGAGLAIPAMTAWYAVSLALPAEGATVFVPAGAGAVGNYAIQFAKARRAGVITTVSSDAKGEIARRAGADHVINYRSEDVAARIADITARTGVDAVLEVDLGAGAKLWPSVLRPRANVVVYGTSSPDHTIPAAYCLTNNINIRFILVYEMTPAETRNAIADITKMLAENRLLHNVALTVPLDKIVVAHESVERGVGGKVIVQIA
ncbi:MAG TPA: NADPH:quinone reductase [Xanthobacteraceae bacterium]